MDTAYSHVDCMLDHSVVTLDSYEVTSEVIIDRGVVES